MKVVGSILVFGFGLAGFIFLDWPKAVLWLLFVIAAYPVALAFTISGPLPSNDLVQLYKVGLSQLPVIGTIIESVSSSHLASHQSPHSKPGERPSPKARTARRPDPK